MNQWDFSDLGIVLEDEENVRRRDPRKITMGWIGGALLSLAVWALVLLFMSTRPAVEPVKKPVAKPQAYIGLIEFELPPAPCAAGRRCI